MKRQDLSPATRHLLATAVFLAICLMGTHPLLYGADLLEIQQRGVLRHLGVPYANFVTGTGDGLELELVQLFARHIGVRHEFVETSWESIIADLTGKIVKPRGDDIEISGEAPVRGDLVATGLTILPWREKIVEFSTPTFPTQVWLVTRADWPLQPIRPTGDIDKDIAEAKSLLKGYRVLGKANTCLDPSLYALEETGTWVTLFEGNLNELAPAVLAGDADYTLLDAPDTLVALRKWPGRIKILGPISPIQTMGYAFSKSSPQLRDAFNHFFSQCLRDGTYRQLVLKYYPAVFEHFPEFFQVKSWE